jgi:hypothetical protein
MCAGRPDQRRPVALGAQPTHAGPRTGSVRRSRPVTRHARRYSARPSSSPPVGQLAATASGPHCGRRFAMASPAQTRQPLARIRRLRGRTGKPVVGPGQASDTGDRKRPEACVASPGGSTHEATSESDNSQHQTRDDQGGSARISRCTIVSAMSAESRPGRYAVASRAMTRARR